MRGLLGAAALALLAQSAACDAEAPRSDGDCTERLTAARGYDRACTNDAECHVVGYPGCPCGSCGDLAVRVEEVERFRDEHPQCPCESRATCGGCPEIVAGCEAGECRMFECVSDGCVERTLLPDNP